MKFFKLAAISAFALSAGAAYASPAVQEAGATPAPTTAPAGTAATTQAPATPDASTASAGTPATAPSTGVDLSVGAKVYDSSGGEVGTIESAASGAVVVNTGSKKATLAENSFVAGPKGATIGMTKVQLEEAVAAATAGGQ